MANEFMFTTTQNVGLKQKIEPVGRLNRNGRYSSTDMLNVNVNVHGPVVPPKRLLRLLAPLNNRTKPLNNFDFLSINISVNQPGRRYHSPERRFLSLAAETLNTQRRERLWHRARFKFVFTTGKWGMGNPLHVALHDLGSRGRWKVCEGWESREI